LVVLVIVIGCICYIYMTSNASQACSYQMEFIIVIIQYDLWNTKLKM